MSVVKLNEGPALPTSVTLFVWKEQIWKVRGFVSLKPESFSFALLHVSALSDSRTTRLQQSQRYLGRPPPLLVIIFTELGFGLHHR